MQNIHLYVVCVEHVALDGVKMKSYIIKSAPPGNRTRVARMGILHDTTTPAAQLL